MPPLKCCFAVVAIFGYFYHSHVQLVKIALHIMPTFFPHRPMLPIYFPHIFFCVWFHDGLQVFINYLNPKNYTHAHKKFPRISFCSEQSRNFDQWNLQKVFSVKQIPVENCQTAKGNHSKVSTRVTIAKYSRSWVRSCVHFYVYKFWLQILLVYSTGVK